MSNDSDKNPLPPGCATASAAGWSRNIRPITSAERRFELEAGGIDPDEVVELTYIPNRTHPPFNFGPPQLIGITTPTGHEQLFLVMPQLIPVDPELFAHTKVLRMAPERTAQNAVQAFGKAMVGLEFTMLVRKDKLSDQAQAAVASPAPPAPRLDLSAFQPPGAEE